jgi:hypothetical protein
MSNVILSASYGQFQTDPLLVTFLSTPIPAVRPVATPVLLAIANMPLWVWDRNFASTSAARTASPVSASRPKAAGLGRRELETGHLEVFRTDSTQQFCKRNVHG